MFAAIGLITATGAFTTVEAERTATVSVSGDSAALLGIEAAGDNPEAASTTDGGVMELDLTGDIGDQNAAGLNPNANTTLTPLVNVTNQGSNPVTLDVTISGVNDTDIDSSNITVVDADGNAFDQGQEFGAGTGTQFGLMIDLTGVTQDELDNNSFEISINIEANEA